MINPVITQSAVARRIQQPTLAEQHAIARHQAALAALNAADRTRELVDATRPMATRNPPADTWGVQTPATAPDAPAVHFIDAATVTTARYITLMTGALLTFIAGVAVGSVL